MVHLLNPLLRYRKLFALFVSGSVELMRNIWLLFYQAPAKPIQMDCMCSFGRVKVFESVRQKIVESYQILITQSLFSVLKGQIKATDIFINFNPLRPGEFKILNEIDINAASYGKMLLRISEHSPGSLSLTNLHKVSSQWFGLRKEARVVGLVALFLVILIHF